MADLVTRPEHSLIHQSFDAEQREEPLNGDGFGVGWYLPEVNPVPAVFTSVSPAWSNRNLMRIADKIISPLIFAHVRAATGGLAVTELNCHPFNTGRYLWMHNGSFGEFDRIKRELRRGLSDYAYENTEGTTDSELAFGMFIDRLPSPTEPLEEKDLVKALVATIQTLNETAEKYKVQEPSFYNFCVSDGKSLIVTRLAFGNNAEPPSLYFAQGKRLVCVDGVSKLDGSGKTDCALISSEPLTRDPSSWAAVEPQSVMIVREDNSLHSECWSDLESSV